MPPFPDVKPSVVVDANGTSYYQGGPSWMARNPVNGHLYLLAFQHPVGNRELKFWRSVDGGFTWNSTRTFTNVNHEGNNQRFMLMIDRNQRLHVLVCSNNPGYLFGHHYSDDEFVTDNLETYGLGWVDLIQGVCSPNNDDRFIKICGTNPSVRYLQTFQDGSFATPSVSFTEGYSSFYTELQQIFNDKFDRKCFPFFDSSGAVFQFTRSTISNPLGPADLGVPVTVWNPGWEIRQYPLVFIDKDSNYMACAIGHRPVGDDWYIRILVSLDNGATWLDRGNLPNSLKVTPNYYYNFLRTAVYWKDNILYVYLNEGGGMGGIPPRIICMYSLDLGVTWSVPIEVVPNASGFVTESTWLGQLYDATLSPVGGRFPIMFGRGAAPAVQETTYFNPGVSEYGSSTAKKVMCDVTGAFTRYDPLPSINQIRGTGQSRR